jgi:hypothetical protein
VTEVQLSALSLGDCLASGGQGSIYAITDDPGIVFKRYHNPADPALAAATLRFLVAERSMIAFAGSPVDEWAAWPAATVCADGRPIGFLMKRVGPEFAITIRGRDKLADLSYLATEPGPLWADVPLPTDQDRVRILHHLAGAMHALHQRGIVFGDVSFANVLWAQSPRPKIMLLDCDGMRPSGRPAVLPQTETLDWDDPMAPARSAPTIEQDRYKLSLAVLRVLARSLDARPHADLCPPMNGLDQSTAVRVGQLLMAAAGHPAARPSAADWANVLSGRVTVPVPLLVARKIDGPPPKPDVLSNAPRVFRPVVPPTS